MATRVTVNSKAIEALLKSSDVRAILRRRAEAVAARARADAPVESGRYRDSIDVEPATTDRAVERVVARAPHSLIVNIKTGNLVRALGAVGG